MTQVVTLANCGFLPYKKTAYLDGPNLHMAPTHFEWQRAEPQVARFVTEEYICEARGPGQVAWILEPFFLHPQPYLDAMTKNFDYVLSHDQNFVANNENWLWYPAGGSRIAFDEWGLRKKTKSVSILLSNKKMTRGHRLRHEIVERFGDRLDVYGLDHPVTPFEALADYRYSIIVENEKSNYWFTEKLIDCISVGTIPLYWGCPDIYAFFDIAGVLPFSGLADLENILECFAWNTGNTFYSDHRFTLEDNLESAKKYRVCEDWIYRQYPFLFEKGSA